MESNDVLLVEQCTPNEWNDASLCVGSRHNGIQFQYFVSVFAQTQ